MDLGVRAFKEKHQYSRMTRVLVGKWIIQGTLAWHTSPIQTGV